MIGRLDLTEKQCQLCLGSKRNPKNKKKPCPSCGGSGLVPYCESCNNYMPCPGTLPVFDQTYCETRSSTNKKELTADSLSVVGTNLLPTDPKELEDLLKAGYIYQPYVALQITKLPETARLGPQNPTMPRDDNCDSLLLDTELE